MKLKVALIVLLIIAALMVSGCCCCCFVPTHRGYYYRIPAFAHGMGPCAVKVTPTNIPITTARPTLAPTPLPVK